MLKLVICIKQVPMVSELPWDRRTGTLQRELAEGMINPTCKHALEAGLVLKNRRDAWITVITMGPPMAEEALREAIAMGADQGILLTDKRMAGADTAVTAFTLARAIESQCPDFDLIICGCHTSDSETAQVGPQLAEELDIAGVTYVKQLELNGATLKVQRIADDFLETLAFDLPGLITIASHANIPRYVPLSGLQDAFDHFDINTLNADDLNLDPDSIGLRGSPTKILDVFSPTADKQNIVLKGTPANIVNQILRDFEDKIGATIGKDLKPGEEAK